MDSTDVFLTIFIFLIFMFLYIFNIFYIKYKEIKRNWPKYKCQPIIMPFATFFGQDVNENFVSCIGNMQGDLMGKFLKPLMGNIGSIQSIGDDLKESLKNTTLLGGNLSLDQLSNFMSFSSLLNQFSVYSESLIDGFSDITQNVVKIGNVVALVGTNVAVMPINLATSPANFLMS